MTASKTDLIKQLRERTGAGVMECQKALQEANGSIDEALKLLQAKGKTIATQKAGRVTGQGTIGAYVHGGRIGVMVEINCETDFVARNDQFKAFVHEICLQIASMNPRVVTREDVSPEEIGNELEQLHENLEGVDEEATQQMQQSHMERFYKERVLLDQPYVKDGSKSVQDLLHETIAATGENVVIKRFTRFVLGEDPAFAQGR